MAFVDNAYNGRVIVQGIMPVKITITATCDVGDLIGYDNITSALWELADANGKIPAQLIAGEQNLTATATEITCFKMAEIDFGTGSTATPGDMVYLSDTAGSYAATPGGWVHQCVGQCITAQRAFIQPDSSPLFGYSTTGTGNGAWIRAELASGKTAASVFCGARIDVKTIATSTVGGDVYGVYVFGQLQKAPTTSSAMIRLEDGCSSSCGFDSYVMCVTGTGDPPDFLMELGALSEPTNNAWSLLTNSSLTAAGRLKIKVGGSTRYISINSD